MSNKARIKPTPGHDILSTSLLNYNFIYLFPYTYAPTSPLFFAHIGQSPAENDPITASRVSESLSRIPPFQEEQRTPEPLSGTLSLLGN
ncbi:hypothetical protein CEXT_813271 [Caerostris extrusa]|uniref:Uncharacterized protein n=1 Tax=Caerostris extrusa TaxID=172846 RepID=A0AAV4QQ86_CAEEX|nr:hypothetical protein CEXT_813271 [Caerostris extrusa]